MRVLIVDDEASVRHVLGRALRHAGFEVMEASDGGEAIRRCREQSFCVVLMDIFMPGKEGIETLRELRTEFPGLKIVAMSGGGSYPFFDALTTAKMLGAVEIFRKPIVVSELLNTFNRLAGEDATAEAVPQVP